VYSSWRLQCKTKKSSFLLEPVAHNTWWLETGFSSLASSTIRQVIFTEPYAAASNNRWTSPQLDEMVAALRSDVELKVAITALKKKFTEQAEALLHGDLHTGSIMVTQSSTQASA
jgi:S-methyl-5-thioribose kinase